MNPYALFFKSYSQKAVFILRRFDAHLNSGVSIQWQTRRMLRWEAPMRGPFFNAQHRPTGLTRWPSPHWRVQETPQSPVRTLSFLDESETNSCGTLAWPRMYLQRLCQTPLLSVLSVPATTAETVPHHWNLNDGWPRSHGVTSSWDHC